MTRGKSNGAEERTMATTQIPRVDDTDLDRDDLVEAAEELDIEHESLDDQQLFEELGRRLGEIDDDAPSGAEDAAESVEDAAGAGGSGEAEEAAEQAESATSSAASTASESVPDPEELHEELQGRTRDQVRDELRELGLPVSGTKTELVERLVAARIGAAREGMEAASEATGEASDAAEDVAEQAGDTAEDTAQQASDTAEDTAQQASDTAEDTAEQASDTAEEVTPDRQAARDEKEYRVENDEREDVAPILDLELGPLALDLLGLDVHLNRVHAVLVANPGPKHALLGKLLSGVAKAADKLGVSSAVGGVTDGVEKVVDALPTPDMGDEGDDEDGDGDDEPGILGRVRNRIAGAGRAAKNLVDHTTDAAGEAKDATVGAATSGGNLKAAKKAKDAFSSAKDAAGAAKDVATGSG
jgi:hypothetical protein